MFDTKSLVVLMKLTVLAMAGLLWAWHSYWPDLPREAVVTLVVLSFVAGCLSTSVYFLTRYKLALTPGKVTE